METTDDYIAVPRRAMAKLIKDLAVASYAVQMFGYLAERKRLEIHMDTDEICRLLDIRRGQLEKMRRKGEIKSFKLGGTRFYGAFDIARAAEAIHRPRRLAKLAKIPSIKLPDQ